MSRLLTPALRRLFAPKADMDGSKTTTHEAAQELGAAVDRHADVNAAQSASYETLLRETMDDLLKKLDQQAQYG